MRDVTNRIASGSAFVPQAKPFHVPFLGSLHTYSRETIDAVIASTPAVRGRFVAWQLVNQQLRAAIELETDGVAACLAPVRTALPHAKPWRSHYVTLGSLVAVDGTLHEPFLAAVKEAFPIDTTQLFTTSHLAYHNDYDRRSSSNRNRLASHHTPATPSGGLIVAGIEPAPKLRISQGGIRKKAKKKAPSAHTKLQRTGNVGSTMDELIRRATRATGGAVSRPRETKQPRGIDRWDAGS